MLESSPRPGAGWRTDIQGLRGVAVVLVLLFHLDGLLPGGFLGVDVFFVLSGFLLTSLMLREMRSTGGVDLRRFLGRRIRRLLPALAAMTVTTVLLGAFVFELGPQYRDILVTAAAASLFAANIAIYFQQGYYAPTAEENALLHTWSLSVEEQLYLALAVLVLIALHLGRRRHVGRSESVLRRLLVGATLISLLASVLLVEFADVLVQTTGRFDGNAQYLAFLAPVTRFWGFGAGALLALAPPAEPSRSRNWSPLVGLVVLAGSVALYSPATPYPGLRSTVPVLATLLILGRPGATSRTPLLESRALVAIGDRSYSWYLWHWPAIVIGRELGATGHLSLALWAAGGLLVAELSYRSIESPLRRKLTDGRTVPLRLLIVTTVAPALLAVTFLAASELMAERAIGADVRRALSRQDLTGIDCALTESCSQRAAGSTALLLGDSHAAALAPALRDALAEGSFALIYDSGSRIVARQPAREAGLLEETVRRVEAIEPDVIVLHSYRIAQITGVDSGVIGPIQFREEDGAAITDLSRALDVYEERLVAGVRTLMERGFGVVIVSSVPDFSVRVENTFGFPTLVDALRGRDVLLTGEIVPRSDVERRNGPVRDVERRVAERTGATVVDPVPFLCSRDDCRQVTDGRLLYRDADHVTYEGAQRFAQAVAEAVSSQSRAQRR